MTIYVAAFEVNFMDDVGQTLLNWASAFGTQEMVKNTHKQPFILIYGFIYDNAEYFLVTHVGSRLKKKN